MGNPDELKQEIKVLRQNLSGWDRTVRTGRRTILMSACR